MDAQKLITRLLLKLPDVILTKMAGGKPVVRDGRTLDPRFAFIGAAAAKRPLPTPLTPAFARDGVDLMTHLFGGDREAGVKTSDLDIPLEGRTLRARAYRPANQRPQAPLFVYYHFGGGVVGNIGTCDAFCTILASTIGCPVVSVDYRLAPEHPWPAGLNDAIDSFLWAREHAAQFGAPDNVAAAGGDSMGGNFTAILAQEMMRRGLPQPVAQILIYPATDITATDGSMQSCGDAYPLTRDTMNWFMANYLPNDADPESLLISPAKATSLTGLAPALVVMAGHDPLYDQGQLYAKRLASDGVSTKVRTYDSLAHGFTAYTGVVPAADKACREIAGDVLAIYRVQGF
jgi:acetyl esterase